MRGKLRARVRVASVASVALMGACGRDNGAPTPVAVSDAGPRSGGLDAAVGGSKVDVATTGSDGDASCASSSASSGGRSSWAQATQTSGGTASVSIVVRGACDDVLVYGRAQATTQWGGGALPAGGFLSHLDGKGGQDWVRSWTDSDTGVFAMAALPGGRFVAVGGLVGPVDLGNGPRVGVGGDMDAFMATYDRTGDLLSLAQYGDEAAQWSTGVASNDSGEIALLATGYGTADFGSGTATPAGWLALLPGSSSSWVVSSFRGTPALGLDAQGLVTIAGALQGPINLGGDSIGVSNGEFVMHAQFYVASYSAAGLRWSKAFLEGGCSSLIVQPDGDIVLAGGVATAGLDVGCGVTPSGSTTYVASLGSDGTCRWMRWFKGTTTALIAADGAGGVVVVGGADGAVQESAGPLPGTGAIYVERFGADGAPSGGQIVGVLRSGTLSMTSVAASQAEVWLGGTISGDLAIAGATLTAPPGDNEGYVARLEL
jgi:hypothetical protein